MVPYHDPYWREGDPANVQEWRSLIQQAMTDISMIAQIPSSSQIAYRPQGNAGRHEDLFSPFRVQVDIWRERERVLSKDVQRAQQRERVLSEDLQQARRDLAAAQAEATTYRAILMDRDRRSSSRSHSRSVSCYTPMGPPSRPDQEGASSRHSPATSPRDRR
ncbi:uncharacterized protein LOC131856344 [Cryptomeria japonica]|uniref:uncharacterized protein LOC131856344 n=1 Tax=Cryptomeria japonica TaxID=3369 RepID=UPI0027DA1AC8|nr:uncharacterized protein LOC131856344 [Cryptomeria japonica]